MLLPGKQAGRVRRKAAKMLVKHIGRDVGVVDELVLSRQRQEQIGRDAPEHPIHVIGEHVEAQPA